MELADTPTGSGLRGDGRTADPDGWRGTGGRSVGAGDGAGVAQQAGLLGLAPHRTRDQWEA